MKLKTFLKHLLLKYSTCLTFQLASCSELKSRRKRDLVALVQAQLHVFHKIRDEGNCDQIVRDSQIGHVKRKGGVTSHLYISLLLWRKQDKAFLVGLVLRMVTAAAAGIQTVQDEPMRLQNAMAQGQCGPAGVPLDLGSFPPLTYAGKRGLVHVFGEQLPLRCRATSHRRERRHQ